MPTVQILLWIVLGGVLVISVVTDLRSARIPDVVTWPALGLLLALRLGFDGVGDLQAGFLTGFVSSLGLMALFALWAWRGRMGWGDVKLMGVVGAAFGFPDAFNALVWISVVGALQAVTKVLLAPKSGPALTQRHIPYAVAIAVGSACAMWGSMG